MPKKYDALLVGYYGMLNTGDDMLMAAAAEGARSLYGSALAATCARGSAVAEWLHCTPVQSRKQRVRAQDRVLKYWGAASSKHIIIGGGSVFHTAKDIAQKRHYLKLAGNREHRAVGVGLGPFMDTEAERQCAAFLNEAAFTGVRDPESFEIAQAIAPNANVKLTYDLAPGLVGSEAFNAALSGGKDHAIGFALCPSERFQGNLQAEEARLKQLAQVARRWHEETGATIRLFDFNGHPELGDEQVHSALMTRLDGVKVEHIAYQANPWQCIAQMSRLKLMVAMRLHAAIFSYLIETPYISLNYHPKCVNWCQDSGHASVNVFDSAGFDSMELMEQGLRVMGGNYLAPTTPIEQARARAISNWEAL